MGKYRRKPTVIEAWQFHVDQPHVRGVCTDAHDITIGHETITVTLRPHVHTAHGGSGVPLTDGDWITADALPDTYYPIKSDVFAATYEPVKD